MREAEEPKVHDDGGDDDEGGGFRIHVSMEEKQQIARDTAEKLFTLLGAGMPEIAVDADEEQIVVRLQNVPAPLVPTGDTRVLESLQFMLSKAINKLALKRTRLTLDADGFRRRRPEGLDRLADTLAQKALALGKPVAIGPLGQGDLRLLATLCAKTPGVSTVAVGPHHLRRLVVQPSALGGTAGVAVATAGAEAGAEPAEGEEGAEAGGEGGRKRRRRR